MVLSKKNTYLLLKAGLQGSGQELKAPEAGQLCPRDLYYLIWLSVPRSCDLPEIDPCLFNSIHVWCLDQLILLFEIDPCFFNSIHVWCLDQLILFFEAVVIFGSPASSLERLSTTRRLQNYKKQVSKRQWQTVFTSMKSNNRDNGMMKRTPKQESDLQQAHEG